MTTEAKFPEVVEAVRLAVLGRLPEEQPVKFAHGFIGEVQGLLGLDFAGGDGIFARQRRDKFCGQVQRALNKLAETRVLVKSGKGRDVRYWSPAAWEAHQAREAAEQAARAAIDARKANLMRRTRLLVADATFWMTAPSRVEMNLDTLAELLDLAERAGS